MCLIFHTKESVEILLRITNYKKSYIINDYLFYEGRDKIATVLLKVLDE